MTAEEDAGDVRARARVHAHAGGESRALRQAVARSEGDDAAAYVAFGGASHQLFGRILPELDESMVPVLVMRGGLTMYTVYRSMTAYRPSGVVVPHRKTFPSDGLPSITYLDIPCRRSGGCPSYLLLDPIVNSGQTIVSVVRRIRDLVARPRFQVATLFLSDRGARAMCAEDPDMQIHTMWAGVEVGADGRLVGVPVDSGDCAFGGRAERVRWVRGSDDAEPVDP
ncbi:uracil phosphoribosyltransferase [Pseudonocardia lacus]|uniref:uracil phosphoribosyltransferase n=1 Tax=Pseudonocardia lacus TaxID=2835865 RepID=UPI001BDC779C|nr:uracil phosphoribosyltransferase [Pseudonocardia lacus]